MWAKPCNGNGIRYGVCRVGSNRLNMQSLLKQRGRDVCLFTVQ